MDPKQTSGDLKDGCQMNTFFNYLFQSEEELKKHGKKRESFKICTIVCNKKSQQRKKHKKVSSVRKIKHL